MDKREKPRHKVLSPVLIAIETDLSRHVGTLLDISKEGFQMRVDWRRSQHELTPNEVGAVEIQLDDDVCTTTCTVVRVTKQRISAHVLTPFEDSFLQLLLGHDWGYVHWGQGIAEVHGRISHAISKDIMEAVRRGMPIDMAKATSLSSRAVGTLQAALIRGGAIRNCNPAISCALRVAGICAECPSGGQCQVQSKEEALL